jgi:hypothetical protein
MPNVPSLTKREKPMRSVLIGLAALVLSAPALAGDVYVHGYTTKSGTYVAPHYRSAPDSNPYNNWSTKGNVNPYTGEAGTRNPYGGNSYSPYGYRAPSSTSPSCLFCSSNSSQTDDGSDPQ